MPRRYFYVRRSGMGDAGNYDFPALQQLAASAGFKGSDANTAAAIALAESAGNPSIIGDRGLAPTNGPSYGLWQINIGTKAHPEFAGWNLADPATNAAAAFQIYQRAGGSFRQWSTFTNFRYTAFLPSAPADSTPPTTIDASTGQPIEDNTPTPTASLPSLDLSSIPAPVLVAAGAALAVLALSEFLDD